MSAALPIDEVERLEALYETGLLDTAPEQEFDDLVRLASVICDMPISLISLVDSDRQWFKANVGTEIEETSRNDAFCAHAILQPEIFIVRDASQDPRFLDNPLVTGEPYVKFYAGFALETEDHFRLGSLCVIDQKPRELNASQQEALRLLSVQANKQINLRRRQRRLELAVATGSAMAEELRQNQGLFHAFMDNAPFLAFMKDFEGRFVYYNQRYAVRFKIDREAWLGKTDAELWPPEIAARERASDHSAKREWKMVTTDDDSCEEHGRPACWRSYKFPFRNAEGLEFVAGFSVDHTADREAERQIQSYQRELEKANEQLLALAVTDGLTGLSNRRAFDTFLRRKMSESQRYGRPLSLMILDVDDFKSFNDTYGHDAGDRVLQQVAAALAQGVRNTDFVARYGGEEFAVLLPGTAKQAAEESAERLRMAVEDCEVAGRGITISIGLAAFDPLVPAKTDLFRRADNALYRAKRAGKNCVHVE